MASTSSGSNVHLGISNVSLINDIYDIVITLNSRPQSELVELMSIHGITLPSNCEADLSLLQKMLLRHFLRSECYVEDDVSSSFACLRQRHLNPDCHTHLRRLFQRVVTAPELGTDHVRALACASLGLEMPRKGSLINCSSILQSYIDCLAVSPDTLVLLRKLDVLAHPQLYAIVVAHRIPLETSKPSAEDLKICIVRHVTSTGCSLETNKARPPQCVPIPASENFGLHILRQAYATRLNVRPLRYLLMSLHIEGIDLSLSHNELLRSVKRFIKMCEKSPWNRPPEQLPLLENRQPTNWPQLTPNNVKERLLNAFIEATSSESLREVSCGICSGSFLHSDMHPKPTELAVLDRSLITPAIPMPPSHIPAFQDHPILTGLSLYPPAVSQSDTMNPSVNMCKTCHSYLTDKRKLPPLSLANDLCLGSVPRELSDLSIIEEALIARRRAKMWVVHLKGDEVEGDSQGVSSVSSRHQRGMRGHVIVYPAEPKKLSQTLPPSLENELTPVCIVFIGSHSPSREWLLEKAKPLIIRTEKVRAALMWLKKNNPLYSDVIIDHSLLDTWPQEPHLPKLDIEIHPPTDLSEMEGSRYDQNDECMSCSSTPCSCPLPNDDHFQNLVVSDVDVTTATKSQLSAAALKHLRSGRNFICASHGSDPVNEYEDEHLFPLLYPTLFPYGRGGFDSKARPVSLSMKAQAKHYFSLADPRFREHYSFLFTVFSILQRRAVSLGAKLKIKHRDFEKFAKDLKAIPLGDLDTALQERIVSSDRRHCNTAASKMVDSLLRNVRVVSSKVPGTSASRVAMRNEMRGLMMEHGLPSFYITINPADIYNPIVKLMAGSDIDVDNILPDDLPNYHEQTVLLARNPFIGAKFFNAYLQAFFKHIIGPLSGDGPTEGGVLGVAKAYYGCVEAQGRGTLHCHMLVWLEGALDPHEIAQKITVEKDDDFRKRLIAFIDDLIHNGLPLHESHVNKTEKLPHPCLIRSLATRHHWGSTTRKADLYRLVKACQTHVHRKTCFKYDPNHCRFDLDENHYVPETFVDPKTGEISYRILDGMINNYNPTILEAMRCNMDIKFIGSGLSAKGILYYVTDYITKSPLRTEVGFSAIQTAIRRLNTLSQETPMNSLDSARTALVKCANRMISHQQLSGPQVASYLCDYGDHYTSHKFQMLFWPAFESFVDKIGDKMFNAVENAEIDSIHNDEQGDIDEIEDDEVILECSNDLIIPSASQCSDYLYRGKQFHQFCVWDFIASVGKQTMNRSKSLSPRMFELLQDESDNDDMMNVDDPDFSFSVKCNLQGRHPQSKTHILYKRRKRLVPVPIGPSLPRRDRVEDFERYCKIMLILFKPWKNIQDLRTHQTWEESFESFCKGASHKHIKVMENMQRLHECRDSRDQMYIERRLHIRGQKQRCTNDDEPFADEPDDADVIDFDALGLVAEGIKKIEATFSRRRDTENIQVQTALKALASSGLLQPASSIMLQTNLQATYDNCRTSAVETMEVAWKKSYESRRHVGDIPNVVDSGTGEITIDKADGLKSWKVSDACACIELCMGIRDPCYMQALNNLEKVSRDFNLNVEQLLAFRCIGESSIFPQSEPLRLYMGGPGGTGKTTVIKAIKEFFRCRGQSGRLKAGAYTGNAARHIEGATLHSLLLLHRIFPNESSEARASSTVKSHLQQIWKEADYLFIDEVSMIGCEFLRKINVALQIARGCIEPYGGINIIFAGDFAQLPPVGDPSLYTSEASLSNRRSSQQRIQNRISGKLLWLQNNACILFDKLMRQKGSENAPFRDLLGRSREGKCTHDDYLLLQKQILTNENSVGDEFKFAPIITPHNNVKDALNDAIASRFAQERGLTLHYYHCVDRYKGVNVSGSELEGILNGLHTGKTDQLMSRLPLADGMPVYLTQNYDVENGIVNGAYGEIKKVFYAVGDSGKRVATSCVLRMPGYIGPSFDGLGQEDVVIFSEDRYFRIYDPIRRGNISIHRTQLPIQPAFAMTDYKSQGRTLEKVILDLKHCKGSQSPYVMLSRATSLDSIQILQDFPEQKIKSHPSADFRAEADRLLRMSLLTLRERGSHLQKQEAMQVLSTLPPPRQPPPVSMRPVKKRRLDEGYQALYASNAVLGSDDI